MEAIKVHKLIECGFIRKEQHLDWVANIVSVLKKNEKIRICINFHDLNPACPKDKFSLPITDVMIETRVASKGCPFWMAFQGTIKSRCIRMTKSIHHSEYHWEYTITQ